MSDFYPGGIVPQNPPQATVASVRPDVQNFLAKTPADIRANFSPIGMGDAATVNAGKIPPLAKPTKEAAIRLAQAQQAWDKANGKSQPIAPIHTSDGSQLSIVNGQITTMAGTGIAQQPTSQSQQPASQGHLDLGASMSHPSESIDGRYTIPPPDTGEGTRSGGTADTTITETDTSGGGESEGQPSNILKDKDKIQQQITVAERTGDWGLAQRLMDQLIFAADMWANKTGEEIPEAGALRQRQADLEKHRAMQVERADEARSIAQRDEMVQAGRDVGLAQQSARAAAGENMGAAGLGAASRAGAEQAYRAGMQRLPGAVQEARARKDTFEQKSLDRMQMAQETAADKNAAEQMRIAKQREYDDMRARNIRQRALGNRASIAASIENRPGYKKTTTTTTTTGPTNTLGTGDNTNAVGGMNTHASNRPPKGSDTAEGRASDTAAEVTDAMKDGQTQQNQYTDDWLAKKFNTPNAVKQGDVANWAKQYPQIEPAMIERLNRWAAWLYANYNKGNNREKHAYDLTVENKKRLLEDAKNGTLQEPQAIRNEPHSTNNQRRPRGIIRSDVRVKNILSDEDMKMLQGINLKGRWT